MLNPTGLCMCGCGQPAPISPASWAAAGYVRGEPRRFIHGHNSRRLDRFITPGRYRVTESGCWEWLGHIDRTTGYGKAGRRGAHRVSYMEHRGPIPAGLTIDHLCRNRACVNPEHLEAVTNAENARRGMMGKKLTPAKALAIYNDPRLGKEIAREYGVTPTIISGIKLRRIWRRATEGKD